MANANGNRVVEKPDAVKIDLPALVSNNAHWKCYNVLSQLDEAQQNKVLTVFSDMEQNNKIRSSATGLFLCLAQLEKKQQLGAVETAPAPAPVVFKGDPEHPNIQYGYSQTPQLPKRAPITEEEKQQAALKEEEERQEQQRRDDYGKLEMLMFHCRSVGITIEAQAERYYMEHILELFPKQVAAFKKKYQGT